VDESPTSLAGLDEAAAAGVISAEVTAAETAAYDDSDLNADLQ
jgi:hypothetical protein